MRLTLLCFAGFTTGMLVTNIQNYAGKEDKISSCGVTSFLKREKMEDVVLIGPQLQNQANKIMESCHNKGIPCAFIDQNAYRNIDGESIFKQAEELYRSR